MLSIVIFFVLADVVSRPREGVTGHCYPCHELGQREGCVGPVGVAVAQLAPFVIVAGRDGRFGNFCRGGSGGGRT